MNRRVTTHHRKTKDNEELTIITIYEPEINKKDVRKLSPYCKKHDVLIYNGQSYEFLNKKA